MQAQPTAHNMVSGNTALGLFCGAYHFEDRRLLKIMNAHVYFGLSN